MITVEPTYVEPWTSQIPHYLKMKLGIAHLFNFGYLELPLSQTIYGFPCMFEKVGLVYCSVLSLV